MDKFKCFVSTCGHVATAADIADQVDGDGRLRPSYLCPECDGENNRELAANRAATGNHYRTGGLK